MAPNHKSSDQYERILPNELRIRLEFGCSGLCLWDENERQLTYESLGLSFFIVRRFVNLHRAFEVNTIRDDISDKEWHNSFIYNELESLSRLLKLILGAGCVVKVFRENLWHDVDVKLLDVIGSGNLMSRDCYRPSLENDFYEVAENERVDELDIKLEMHQYGWASLFLKTYNVKHEVDLSNVYDPFEAISFFIYTVEKRSLPAKLEINEEGLITHLTMQETNKQNLARLKIQRGDTGDFSYLLIDKNTFVTKFKNEIARFCIEDFDTRHWDLIGFDDWEDYFVCTRDRLMSHPWLQDSLLTVKEERK